MTIFPLFGDARRHSWPPFVGLWREGEIALQDAVEGAVVVACQWATLLEYLHRPREIYLGPAGGRGQVLNDFNAVLEGGPVAVIVCVWALEPANEVAVVEIETEESSCHASYSGFVRRFVRGWGWARFEQMVDGGV